MPDVEDQCCSSLVEREWKRVTAANDLETKRLALHVTICTFQTSERKGGYAKAMMNELHSKREYLERCWRSVDAFLAGGAAASGTDTKGAAAHSAHPCQSHLQRPVRCPRCF